MPDILILGQITVDHAVPAEPGPWRASVGGNALYAAAGARLWCDPARIGVVARLGHGLPGDVAGLLEAAGLTPAGLRRVDTEPLVEWLLYEPDGSRRTLPRNPSLRDPHADAETLRGRYLAQLEAVSAAADDVPAGWLPAVAVHLAPQVRARHEASVARLRGLAGFLSVDPSPHYARGRDERALAEMLGGISAFLPSRVEVEHLASGGDWTALAFRLGAAGFGEIVIKLGGEGCLLYRAGEGGPVRVPAAPAAVVDLTGAGDAFCGAYAACRALGRSPADAARRAAVAAAMVVECAGAPAALALSPAEAHRRLPRLAAGTR
ncbi:MAG TPA: carbohydrate kinase family protein [Methylomirabilota bacterium]|nr:carbohydrate kinase family protein [Methylomirabilota bacterium]